MSPPRILGAALEPLDDYRLTETRTSRLFVELERLFPITGFIRPQLVGPEDWTSKLRAFHPNRDAWRGRAWLSPEAFRRRTSLAERELQAWAGEYDLVFPTTDPVRTGNRSLAALRDLHGQHLHADAASLSSLGASQRRGGSRVAELEKATFRSARMVFGMSQWVCDAIVDDYGCEPERVVPVGAGANALASSIEDKAYARRIAIFVGNKYELKGVPTLLQAWDVVRERLPDALLCIVGVDQKGRKASWPSVQWLGYIDDRRQLEQLYAEASLFVLPTQFEAFGHAVVEAMGSGLPCITSNVGALPEIVDDGTTGLLVPRATRLRSPRR